MPRDLLVSFKGVKFLARKGRTDILLLSELSEPWMTYYFKPKEGDVVIDVGAHVGKYALYSAKLVGESGVVIAIEPHPENYRALMRNIELNGFKNVIALNVAAYNCNGKKMPLIGSIDQEYTVKAAVEEGCILVETKKIDSVLEELDIQKVDYAKVDVEGAELEVLEGMEKCIKGNSSLKILIEERRAYEEDIKKILEGFKEEYVDDLGSNVRVKYYYR
jgi:FkbM family methyltransferase